MEAIALEAATWIDTPFHLGARKKGVGVDCAGLVASCLEACGVEVPDDLRYDLGDHIERIENALDKISTRVFRGDIPVQPGKGATILDAPILTGDIVVFRSRALPQHLAIVETPAVVISAYGPPISRVVRTPLDSKWRDRIYGVWRV